MKPKTMVLKRARARRRSRGAAMFIVAITLGLLAAMGVYGLTATAQDVRAAGHMRQAAQGQHAAELALVLTSQVIGPGNADSFVTQLQRASPTVKCKSNKPYDATDAAVNSVAQACVSLRPDSMKVYAADPSAWPTASAPHTVPFSPESFGEVPVYPQINVELTNLVYAKAPPGYGANMQFAQFRTSVYVEMRGATATAPADMIAAGRGRLVAGPFPATQGN